MEARVIIEGFEWRFDAKDPIDISIPLIFNGPQPNAYGVPPAAAEPCVSGDLIGDTRRGGSCNFETYTFIPHCNGTHTECVGHLTRERISLRDCLQDVLIPARLITIDPRYSSGTAETYSVSIDTSDRLITREQLQSAAGNRSANGMVRSPHEALIIRTLPNDDRKLTRQYVDVVPPYFTTEAMQFIVESGFAHLVVDLPSVDRLYDEGKLSNHRIFWKVEPGSFEADDTTRRKSTITEMAYIPNKVEDGEYLLNLQIAPFSSDASPSRPLLLRLAKH